MGIIKDSIGQVLGAGQLNTGFNKPFSRSSSPQRDDRPYQSDNQYNGNDRVHLSPNMTPYDNTHASRPQSLSYQDDRYLRPRFDPRYGYGNPNIDGLAWNVAPPVYEAQTNYPRNSDQYRPQSQYGGSLSYNDSQSIRRDYDQPYNSNQGCSNYGSNSMQDVTMSSNYSFRPLALPQIDYGDGRPFLRGYSSELRRYGIEQQQFIDILDDINNAIIPNPENQIFQKAANIAGWFVPGSAGLALMGGQVAVGLGAAFGHSSFVNKTLAKANLEVFVPRGLEICLGDSARIRQELGIPLQYDQRGPLSPESRIAACGDRIARLSVVYPPTQQARRSDPIAMLGKSLNAREQSKKAEKAAEARAKGENSKDANALENSLKWILVRKASPGSTAQWRKTLQQSEAALQDEQRQTASHSAR